MALSAYSSEQLAGFVLGMFLITIVIISAVIYILVRHKEHLRTSCTQRMTPGAAVVVIKSEIAGNSGVNCSSNYSPNSRGQFPPPRPPMNGQVMSMNRGSDSGHGFSRNGSNRQEQNSSSEENPSPQPDLVPTYLVPLNTNGPMSRKAVDTGNGQGNNNIKEMVIGGRKENGNCSGTEVKVLGTNGSKELRDEEEEENQEFYSSSDERCIDSSKNCSRTGHPSEGNRREHSRSNERSDDPVNGQEQEKYFPDKNLLIRELEEKMRERARIANGSASESDDNVQEELYNHNSVDRSLRGLIRSRINPRRSSLSDLPSLARANGISKNIPPPNGKANNFNTSFDTAMMMMSPSSSPVPFTSDARADRRLEMIKSQQTRLDLARRRSTSHALASYNQQTMVPDAIYGQINYPARAGIQSNNFQTLPHSQVGRNINGDQHYISRDATHFRDARLNDSERLSILIRKQKELAHAVSKLNQGNGPYLKSTNSEFIPSAQSPSFLLSTHAQSSSSSNKSPSNTISSSISSSTASNSTVTGFNHRLITGD